MMTYTVYIYIYMYIHGIGVNSLWWHVLEDDLWRLSYPTDNIYYYVKFDINVY